MQTLSDFVRTANAPLLQAQADQLGYLSKQLSARGISADDLVEELTEFQVAIPSWALGTGGTRFGRFPGTGEPASLEQKLEDVGLLHALSATAGAVSLHIPWDVPTDAQAIIQQAERLGLSFDAVNSNTFQDQPGQELSYKFGSLHHVDEGVRAQAIAHNLEVIRQGEALGSKALTVWLADGSCFPGQLNFRGAFRRTLDSLEQIYAALPSDWQMYVEYKPFEPNFYSTTIPDWGTSLELCRSIGPKANVLVDLGHHLPNTNIEQIVAQLIGLGRLGGFHFNDSKYGDDDLTVGSIKPFQLYLIFVELVWGMGHNDAGNPPLAWMIDASHNLKDPLEDLLQSLDNILIAYAKAMLVDFEALEEAQNLNDVLRCTEILKDAFETDVRPLVRESRLRAGAAINPLSAFRSGGFRQNLTASRGTSSRATGL